MAYGTNEFNLQSPTPLAFGPALPLVSDPRLLLRRRAAHRGLRYRR
jgi:hypothetical protein